MRPMATWILSWSLLCACACGQQPEVVQFTTSDGVVIVGDYHAPEKPKSPAVVLLHMYRSDRSAWAPLVPTLRSAGFAVLAIDLRGHGESVSPGSMELVRRALERDATLFNPMHFDVAAAHAFLSKRKNIDLSRLAIVGASVGCGVAIDYAARDRSVDVVVCMTPGTHYLGIDSLAHIRRYGERPILLLATADERSACDQLGTLSGSGTADIVGPGRVHGTQMFGVIDGIASRIASFVDKHVGDRDGIPVVGSVDGKAYFAFGSKEHIDMPPEKVRWFSSVEEARAKGSTGPDSPSEGQVGFSRQPDRKRLPQKASPEPPSEKPRIEIKPRKPKN